MEKIFKQFQGLRQYGLKYTPFILARLGLKRSGEITVKFFWGKTVKLPFNAVTTELYYLQAVPEPRLIDFLSKTLKEGDVFYDIGANYGFYSFLASHLRAKVFLFEPIAENCKAIRKNISPAEDISVNEVAVGEVANEQIPFYEATIRNSQSSADSKAVEGVKTRKVLAKTESIDNFVLTHPKPTVLKIDVEGFEEKVIKGGSTFFRDNFPVIIMEAWGGEKGEQFAPPAITYLNSLGYKIRENLDGNNVFRKVSA